MYVTTIIWYLTLFIYVPYFYLLQAPSLCISILHAHFNHILHVPWSYIILLIQTLNFIYVSYLCVIQFLSLCISVLPTRVPQQPSVCNSILYSLPLCCMYLNLLLQPLYPSISFSFLLRYGSPLFYLSVSPISILLIESSPSI